LAAVLADGAGDERAVGAGDLVGELLQRNAVERQPFGIGLDADLFRLFADDIGQADIRQLGDLDLELAGDLGQAVGIPARCDGFGRRQGDDDDCDVVDTAADDERLGDADGDTVVVGTDLLVDPQDRGVGAGADQRAVTVARSSSVCE